MWSNWPFIVAAYAVAWIVLAGYGLYLSARGGRAKRAAAEAEQDG